MAIKQSDFFPLAFKTCERTPRSFNSAERIILEQTPICRGRMAAILNNGRHLGFSNGQSGNFDQKHQLNVQKMSCLYHNLHDSYQILLLPVTLIIILYHHKLHWTILPASFSGVFVGT